MSYPSSIDTFNIIDTSRYEDEAGYVLHQHLNSHGSAANAIETTLGTNSGTSVLKDFTAGEFAVARNSAGALQDTLTAGTLNNTILGTPTVTGGTFTSSVLAGTPVLDVNSAIPFYGDNMSRQAIINGNFDVWQRGVTGATLVDAGPTAYLADRWGDYVQDDGGTLPTLTRTRVTQTAGDLANSFFFSRLTTNGAGSSLGNNSVSLYGQTIEHGTRLLCGNGKNVTVSFYAKSSIANKKIGIALLQTYGTGGLPTATENISGTTWTLTTAWVKYTYTFTTNTLVGKTFGTGDNDYLYLAIGNQWGSTQGTLYGWGSAETYVGSGTIDIAQVQLCAGGVALPFQPKSIRQELTDCQRYTFVPDASTANLIISEYGQAYSTTACQPPISFPVTMRAAPTIESATAADWQVWNNSYGALDVTALVLSSSTKDRAILLVEVASGLYVRDMYELTADASAPRYIVFSAEL